MVVSWGFHDIVLEASILLEGGGHPIEPPSNSARKINSQLGSPCGCIKLNYQHLDKHGGRTRCGSGNPEAEKELTELCHGPSVASVASGVC